MTLTLVSLFDGVAGFPLAFSRRGVRPVAAVEIDAAAASISARHFPGMTHFPDVCEVTGAALRSAGFVPERGIVSAGWPCQDNSVAGRRAGMDGARSGLWREVVRLLAETRPAWFVGENVPGLLAVNAGRDFRRVVSSLDELGYGVAWRVLDAQFFGVAQRRRRVVIVGRLGDGAAPAEVLLEPESGAGDSAARRTAEADVADASRGSAARPGGEVAPALVCSTLQGGGRRGYRIDAEAAAGGQLVVQRWCREVVSTLTASSLGGIGGVDDNSAQAGHLVVRSCRPTTSDLNGGEGVSSTTVRRLTPLECERLQGYPDGWTAGQSDSARYRQLGNSIAVPVFEWVARRLVASDVRQRRVVASLVDADEVR